VLSETPVATVVYVAHAPVYRIHFIHKFTDFILRHTVNHIRTYNIATKHITKQYIYLLATHYVSTGRHQGCDDI